MTKYLVHMLMLESSSNDSASSSQYYLDTTVTKFLDSEEDGIAVTKYLGSTTPAAPRDSNAVSKYLNGPLDNPSAKFLESANDVSVTKFLDHDQSKEDGIAVTKYLGQRSNDIVVTMFNLDTTVTKFLGDSDITIIEFLDTVLPDALDQNDISVTKFLDRQIGQFLVDNDISVTKFLQEADNEISITKFLQNNQRYYGDFGSTYGHYYRPPGYEPRL